MPKKRADSRKTGGTKRKWRGGHVLLPQSVVTELVTETDYQDVEREVAEFFEQRPIFCAIAVRLTELAREISKLPQHSPERKELEQRFRISNSSPAAANVVCGSTSAATVTARRAMRRPASEARPLNGDEIWWVRTPRVPIQKQVGAKALCGSMQCSTSPPRRLAGQPTVLRHARAAGHRASLCPRSWRAHGGATCDGEEANND